MSITPLRTAPAGRSRIAGRGRNDATTRKLADANRAAAELLASNAALQRELDIERFENTRLAQEIANLRRALRLAERALDLATNPA